MQAANGGRPVESSGWAQRLHSVSLAQSRSMRSDQEVVVQHASSKAIKCQLPHLAELLRLSAIST